MLSSTPKKTKEDNKSSYTFRLAVLVSVSWLALFVGIIVVRWRELSNAELNVIGDFLGGFFAPLAFLWFVVTVFLQRKELQLTREELGRQSRALETTVGIEQTRHILEQKDQMQKELTRRRNDLIGKMMPLLEWLEQAKPIRNADTGERIHNDEVEQMFKQLPSLGTLHTENLKFLDRFSSTLEQWNKSFRSSLGPFAQTLDDHNCNSGRSLWKEFRAWWADSCSLALRVDDSQFEVACEHVGVKTLIRIMGSVFEGEFVIVASSPAE